MWSRVKRIPEGFKSKMSKPDELALESLQDTSASPTSDHEVPDEDSSIEALNWSDFDEEEMEMARKLAEKEFPDSTNIEGQDTQEKTMGLETGLESEKESDESTQTSVTSVVASQVLPDVEFPEMLDTEPTTVVENNELEEDFVTMGMTSGEGLDSNAAINEDSVSNAPVLDDGPIWGKGEKLYRFHENRTINQKLTFGVLISVVLAIGIGVGNLVAYNEYETEISKVDHVHCPAHVHSPQTDEKPNDVPLPTGFPSSTHIKEKGPSAIHGASLDPDANSKETLAYVVKSIDELSRKIDQFQNTTKQLSGIIVMKDDTKILSEDRKPRDVLKAKEKIEDDLLPTFNDDVSSWDTSGERHVKFSDVVYEQTSHEVPTSQNDIAEGQPDAVYLKTSTDELSTPLAGVDELKYGTLIPERGSAPEPVKMRGSESSKNSESYKDKAHKREKSPEKDKFNPKRGKSADRDDPRLRREKSVDRDQQKKLKREQSVDRDDSERPSKIFKKEKSPEKDREPTQKRERVRDAVQAVIQASDKKRRQDRRSDQDHPQRNKKLKRQNAIDEGDFPKREYKPRWESHLDYETARNEIYSNKNFQREKSVQKEQKRVLEEHKENEKKNNKRENILQQQPDEQWMKTRKYKKDKTVDRDYVPLNAKFSNSGDNLEDFKTKSKQYKNNKPNRESFRSEGDRNNEIKIEEPLKPRNFDGPNNYNPYRSNKDVGNLDWDSFRAKARENQRVQQNWDNDFRSEKAKRKRNQNWQIERDRIREKFRKDCKD